MAFWFNIGVQIFLVMSGFLSGAKNIPNYCDWYTKRFKRILKPYYIYLIIIIPVFLIFNGNNISSVQIIYYLLILQGVSGSISGLGHLWYITLIDICYLITPIIFKYNISRKENSKLKFYFLMVGQFIILQLIFLKLGSNLGPWVATYMFGFYLAWRYNYKTTKRIKYLFAGVTIMLLPIIIYFQYFYSSKVITPIIRMIYLLFPWYHALLGCTIFIILFDMLSKYGKLRNKMFFTRSIYLIDKYSYEMYITHSVYILGTFSMLKITKYGILNILIISLMIGLSSLILKRLSNIEIKYILVPYKRKLIRNLQ